MTILSFFIVKKILWPKSELQVLQGNRTVERSMLKKQMNLTEKKTLILIILLMAGWVTERYMAMILLLLRW